jgi:hypothetical protein
MDPQLQALLVLILAAAPSAVGITYLLRRERALRASLEAYVVLFDEIAARAERIEVTGQQIAQERERETVDALRRVQADVKLLQMQMRDTGASREAPELLDFAVRLAREGASTQQIIERTRLPLELVETIIALHAGRQA